MQSMGYGMEQCGIRIIQSMGYGLEPSAKRQFIDATPTPLPQIYHRSDSCEAMNLSTIFIATTVFIAVTWKENILERNKEKFQILSKSKIIALKSSTKWGVLIPNKNGEIRLIKGDYVEVVTLHLGLDKNLELNKEIWKLSRLELLKVDNPLSKVQTNIVTAVQQKLDLQADLEQLTVNAQKAKNMYELTKGVESDLEVVQKYKDIYLQHLTAISQVNVSQSLQVENIKQLLLFGEIVKFDQENITLDSYEYPETITETKENYLESVDRVREYLKLRV